MADSCDRVAFKDIPPGGRVMIIGENVEGTEVSFRLMARHPATGLLESFDCSRQDARDFLKATAKHRVGHVARPRKAVAAAGDRAP